MNKCEICGKIIKNYYRICSECYDRYLDGDIIQCSECNTYHWYNEACPKCNYFDNLPSEGFDECIICGQNSNGYAFCKECWQEYDDEQLLSILNNYVQKENEQVYPNDIDDYRKRYPANFHCRDGHYVRSPYEKIIDEVLYEERIIHEYEKKIQRVRWKNLLS